MSGDFGQQAGQAASLGRSLAIFGLALTGTGVLAAALGWGLAQPLLVAGLFLPILLLSALLSGRGFARQTGRGPTGAETAAFSMAALLLALVLALAAVLGGLAVQGLPMTFAGFVSAYIGNPAMAEWVSRMGLALLELAPWLALLILWLGFRRGATEPPSQVVAAPR